MKKIIGITAIIVLLIGCQPPNISVRPTVVVTGAPRSLRSDQWGVLTIFQIYKRGDGLVTLREDKLGEVALYSMRNEISDPSEDGSGCRVCVYSVKPLHSVTIDRSFFLNAPPSFQPVTFEVEQKNQ